MYNLMLKNYNKNPRLYADSLGFFMFKLLKKSEVLSSPFFIHDISINSTTVTN